MGNLQVNSTAAPAASSWQSQSAAQPSASQAREKEDTSQTICEMMKDAKEKADATREKFNSIKPKIGRASCRERV